MISLSPPLNTGQQGGGSARAGVTAGIQRVDPLPPSLVILPATHAGPWYPHKHLRPPPPTSVSRAERLIPSCQPAWKKESRLPGGRGMARVTLGGPFLKEPPRTSPTGFPRGTAVFGEIKMVCAGWLSHGFLCLTFPPPCILMSLSLLFAQPC